jgi:serine O-acetyltransferase
MILSLQSRALAEYVARQLAAFFPDGRPASAVGAAIDETLARLERAFGAVADARFSAAGEARFDHLHSDQYAMFVYLLSNTVYRRGEDPALCAKLFCLNKALYGVDVFYEVELPSIFLFSHAGGTVLGRATYGDYFLVYQHCTVGSARAEEGAGRGLFPVFGRHVSLYAGSSVLGACRLGDNCKISAHSLIMNKRLKPNTIYRGVPQSYETATYAFPDNVWRAVSSEPV